MTWNRLDQTRRGWLIIAQYSVFTNGICVLVHLCIFNLYFIITYLQIYILLSSIFVFPNKFPLPHRSTYRFCLSDFFASWGPASDPAKRCSLSQVLQSASDTWNFLGDFSQDHNNIFLAIWYPRAIRWIFPHLTRSFRVCIFYVSSN